MCWLESLLVSRSASQQQKLHILSQDWVQCTAMDFCNILIGWEILLSGQCSFLMPREIWNALLQNENYIQCWRTCRKYADHRAAKLHLQPAAPLPPFPTSSTLCPLPAVALLPALRTGFAPPLSPSKRLQAPLWFAQLWPLDQCSGSICLYLYRAVEAGKLKRDCLSLWKLKVAGAEAGSPLIGHRRWLSVTLHQAVLLLRDTKKGLKGSS